MRDTKPARSGPPGSVYLLIAVVLLSAISAILGMSGLFPGWIVAGVLIVAAGIVVVIQMIRRNRGAA